MELKAAPGMCQEASPSSREFYIPCNKPAVVIVSNGRGETYRMCEACSYHNVKNRGFQVISNYTPEQTAEPVQPDLSAYEADAQLTQGEADNILAQITNTVRELRDAQDDVKSAEAQLKSAQDRVKNLTETTLPLLMDEAKQKRLTTSDGWEIERGEVVRASISAAHMPAASAWLKANGHGAIVKTQVTLSFGKGEEQRVEEAVQVLDQHKLPHEDKESVHPQTLGALVRELLGEGKELPMDLLGVYVQPMVKIKPVKK